MRMAPSVSWKTIGLLTSTHTWPFRKGGQALLPSGLLSRMLCPHPGRKQPILWCPQWLTLSSATSPCSRTFSWNGTWHFQGAREDVPPTTGSAASTASRAARMDNRAASAVGALNQDSRAAGMGNRVVEWCKKKFSCPVCQRKPKVQSQRPGRLQQAMSFNEVVGVDLFQYEERLMMNMICWGRRPSLRAGHPHSLHRCTKPLAEQPHGEGWGHLQDPTGDSHPRDLSHHRGGDPHGSL